MTLADALNGRIYEPMRHITVFKTESAWPVQSLGPETRPVAGPVKAADQLSSTQRHIINPHQALGQSAEVSWSMRSMLDNCEIIWKYN